jgi:squalene cyclase
MPPSRAAVEKLLVVTDKEAYCQPCFSPVWDTGLACHALLEVGGERALAQVDKSLEWLRSKQILDVSGDWAEQRPLPAPRRLGVPVQQSALSGCRRHCRCRHGDGSRPESER